LKVALTGANLTDHFLLDDTAKLSTSRNAARLAGCSPRLGGAFSHFLCLDGFGAPSQEELKAGCSFHGEAGSQRFKIPESGKNGLISIIKLAAKLPLALESGTHTIQMVDGESVVYVETGVECLLLINRPIPCAEHATLGPPFLESGKVTVDMPASRCRERENKPRLESGEVRATLAAQSFLLGSRSIRGAACRSGPLLLQIKSRNSAPG
jgi:hypothetical protein